jgi:hypothetical protein
MNLSLLVMKDEEVRLLKRQNDSSNKKKMMKMSEVKVNQVQKLKCLRLEVKRKKQLQGQQLLKNLPQKSQVSQESRR